MYCNAINFRTIDICHVLQFDVGHFQSTAIQTRHRGWAFRCGECA